MNLHIIHIDVWLFPQQYHGAGTIQDERIEMIAVNTPWIASTLGELWNVLLFLIADLSETGSLMLSTNPWFGFVTHDSPWDVFEQTIATSHDVTPKGKGLREIQDCSGYAVFVLHGEAFQLWQYFVN